MYEEYQRVSNNTHTVFPGLRVLKEGQQLEPRKIPGLLEAGWHEEMGKAVPEMNPLYPLLRQLLTDLQVGHCDSVHIIYFNSL
jgi:hypothetical protein